MRTRVVSSFVSVAIVAASLLSPARAAVPGWFFAEIDRMQVTPSGGLSVYFHGGVDAGCGSNHIDYAGGGTADGLRMIYAALLTYEAQHEPVQFLITSCSGSTGLFANIESNPG